jgi:hypothetical protein
MQAIDKRDFTVSDQGWDTYQIEWCPDNGLRGDAVLKVDITTTVCKGDGYITPDFSDTTLDGLDVIETNFDHYNEETGEERPVTPEEHKFILQTLINHLTENYLHL